MALCELMSKTTRERKLENEERADTPTVRALYEIILELNHKMIKMDHKMQEMSKWVDSKKRKINMVDWLQEKHTEGITMDWDQFTKSFRVQREQLDHLFQTDYTSSIVTILADKLSQESTLNNPLKAFDHQINTFFAYVNKQWCILPDKLLQNLINIIGKQLLDEFVLWQTENASRMDQDDFALKYSANVKKIMGGNLSREQIYTKIKIELYKCLKVHVKSIMEYQFI